MKHRMTTSSKFKAASGLYIFFYFLILNLFITFVPLSPSAMNGLILIGIVLPLLGLIFKLRASSRDIWVNTSIPSLTIPSWIIFLLAALAVCIRFYSLVSFAHWPLFDELSYAYLGMDLARNLDFHMFYGWNQNVPLPVWALALLFKLNGISLSTVWLGPCILGILSLGLVSLSIRKFLPSPSAGAFTLLWAFGFWPLYAGRFCTQYPVFIFWFCLSFYLFSRFIQAPRGGKKLFSLILFSIFTGLGFYTALNGWSLIFAALSLLLLFQTLKRMRFFLIHLIVTAAVIIPIAISTLSNPYGSYVQSLWAFQGRFDWAGYLSTLAGYFHGLFWSFPPESRVPSYGPHWGGMLNPIMGALFFLGLVRVCKAKPFFKSVILLVLLFLFLTPAFLTNNVTFQRVFQIFPLLLLIAVLGLGYLLENVPTRWKRPALVILLLTSSSLDVYHLLGPVAQGQVATAAWNSKSNYRYQSFQILDQLQKQQGPGLIFDKFQSLTYLNYTPRYTDPSLSIATYSFNALENPKLHVNDVRWAALLCDSVFQSYLSKQYPDARWFHLSYIPGLSEGEEYLCVIPEPRKHPEITGPWVEADRAYQPVLLCMLNQVLGQPNDRIWEALLSAYPLLQGHPFLESNFWLKFARLGEEDAGRYLAQGDRLKLLKPHIMDSPLLKERLGRLYYFAGQAYYEAKRYSDAWWAFTKSGEYDKRFKIPEKFRKKLEERIGAKNTGKV